MRRIGRGFTAFGFSFCLQAMTWGCSHRTPPAGTPVDPSDRSPKDPSTVAVAPELPTPPSASTFHPDDCALIAAPGEPIATVGITDRIDPANAPRPSNESERLLFRQLYETLVRADCRAGVRPGLAASWRLDSDGRTWIVALRENARFSDGTLVTAADVRASWSRDGVGGDLRQDVGRLVESAVAVDDRTLAIALRSRADVPLALAHPDLAVARTVPDSPWPLGTRSARVAPGTDARRTIPASVLTIARDNFPAIRFLVATGDPRDLLDQGIDLLITRDAAALEYAATLPHFQSVPLPWQRTHVLLSPGRARASPLLLEDARQALAEDAVRGEARGAPGPPWWETLADCEVPPPPLRNQRSFTQRIVYDANDGAARDLAERLVGLARASGPSATTFLDALLPDRPRRTYQRAAGLTGEALALARRVGTDAGYVMSLDSRPVDPCRDLHVLIESAPWADPQTIVPLVETRMHAVLRRGRAGAIAEWDGGVMVAGPSGPK